MSHSIEQSVESLLQLGNINEAVESVQAAIRSAPTDFRHRWVLFQFFCIQKQWDKALKQLQVCASLDSEMHANAYTMRTLIQCEMHREKVFQGESEPGFVFEQSNWMQALLRALQHNLKGNTEKADQVRLSAFEQVPEVQGAINGKPFVWISDKDSRMGPVVELYTVGAYRWCSFQDIIALQFEAPKSLLDLVWRKVRCELVDSSIIYAYIPARYVSSDETITEPDSSALLLGRQTVWIEQGETLVQGVGQRMWMTDKDDFSILDCQELVIYREIDHETHQNTE